MTPTALSSLYARAHDALDEMRSLHIVDPAVGPAMRAIRLTEHTLTTFWLRPLDRQLGASEDAGRSRTLDLDTPEEPGEPIGG